MIQKAKGLFKGLSHLWTLFLSYKRMTETVKICDQSDGCSIAWEMLVQFFKANIYDPPGFYLPYLHKYPHNLANFLDTIFNFCEKHWSWLWQHLLLANHLHCRLKWLGNIQQNTIRYQYQISGVFYLVWKTRWIVRVGHCHIVTGSLEVCRLFSLLVIICSTWEVYLSNIWYSKNVARYFTGVWE